MISLARRLTIRRAISKGDLTVLRRDLKATATMWKQAARLDLPELVFVLPLEKVVCLPVQTNCSSSVLRARRKRLLQYELEPIMSRMSDRQLERLFCDETVGALAQRVLRNRQYSFDNQLRSIGML